MPHRFGQRNDGNLAARKQRVCKLDRWGEAAQRYRNCIYLLWPGGRSRYNNGITRRCTNRDAGDTPEARNPGGVIATPRLGLIWCVANKFGESARPLGGRVSVIQCTRLADINIARSQAFCIPDCVCLGGNVKTYQVTPAGRQRGTETSSRSEPGAGQLV